MMLIMLAGLQSQPSDILEAAEVDGATPFGIFRQLTLPHLRRYLELGALLGSIYIVQAFDADRRDDRRRARLDERPVLRLRGVDRRRVPLRLGVRLRDRRRDLLDHHRDLLVARAVRAC